MTFGKLNYVNVGPRGTFNASGDYVTSPADVDAIFAHLGQQTNPKLVMHFHGGLISEAKGIEIARKLEDAYSRAGAHPVTFVWETGLLETITRNLHTVHKTELFQAILRVLIRKTMGKLGVSVGGKGAGGVLDDAQIEEQLQNEAPFDDMQFTSGARGGARQMDELSAELARQEVQEELEVEFEHDAELRRLLIDEAVAPKTPFLERQEIVVMGAPEEKGLFSAAKAAISVAQIFYRIVKRFVRQRDHDFYPTIVEELLRKLFVGSVGSWVWAGMKVAGQQMWRPSDGTVGSEHAGTYFLKKLAAFQQNTPLTVDLVGHSAGSIAILELLRALNSWSLDVRLRHLLLLAPACTTTLFGQSIAAARWQSIRIFTMSDTFEKQDKLIPGVYPRSLLYFVSGLLEENVDEPILGMARFLSGEKPFDDQHLLDVRDYLKDTAGGRLALANWTTENPGAAAGFRTGSTTHGGFDDDEDTLESIRHLICQ